MLEWGFSTKELGEIVNELKKYYFDEDIMEVISRIVRTLKGRKKAKTKFFLDILTIAFLDQHMTDKEREYSEYIGKQLGFTRSEALDLLDEGAGRAIVFNQLS